MFPRSFVYLLLKVIPKENPLVEGELEEICSFEYNGYDTPRENYSFYMKSPHSKDIFEVIDSIVNDIISAEQDITSGEQELLN